jgi:hypothetical protein
MEMIDIVCKVVASAADACSELHTSWMIVHEFRSKLSNIAYTLNLASLLKDF